MGRFRCVLKERTARYSPQFAAKIVMACAVLHNMCIINNMPLPVEIQIPPEDQDRLPIPAMPPAERGHQGIIKRDTIVNLYFRN